MKETIFKRFEIMMKKFTLSLFLLVVGIAHLFAQTKSSSEILHELQKLEFNGKVLYIAAHPDDENTRLISWLTNDLKADVSYLSLTRGDGGQNLIGTEIGEGLGLLRSNELLSARGVDGADQYFTRAIDFGYSKTPAETYDFWNKELVLGDMVKVIRELQPDIIITRFSEVENPDRPTHGHHTASAQLAREAMNAAKDPNKFKHQLDKLEIWGVKKLYWNTSWWFYGSKDLMEEKVNEAPNKYVRIDVNSYLPLIGSHCSEISAQSRSQHKSQGFGSSPVIGEQIEYLQWMGGLEGEGNLFSGIPTKWSEVQGGKSVESSLKRLIDHYDVNSPQSSIEALFSLRNTVDALDEKCKWKKTTIERINQIILMCLGSQVQANISAQSAYAGEELDISFSMDHPRNLNADFKIKKGFYRGFETLPELNVELKDGKWAGRNTVKIPRDITKSQPYWLAGNKTKGSYSVDEENVGRAFNIYPFILELTLAIGENELKLPIPVKYYTTDPVKGRIIQPLQIRPDVMLNTSSSVMIFPNSEAKKISAHVIAGKPNMEGYVELNTNDGWKTEPAFFKCNLKEKGEEQIFEFKVIPPANQSSSSIRAIFKTSSIYSSGLKSLNYDHVPNLDWFPISEFAVRKIELKRKGNKLGYIEGAGDKVAEHLRVMGYSVEVLDPNNLTSNALSSYDAVLVGIRAFNTVENIANINSVLNTYSEKGGTVIFQYNTSHRLKSESIGPFELELGRGRVTEEDAEVIFLEPSHPVLNIPNKLSSTDFEGWVQERGLYFPSKWSDSYTPILGMADKGSEELKGSLLVAKNGNGYVVYTGISFFRELPAGVPGAYRLLANIIALGN